uniref:Fibronectin type-III domain-containing protein n=1 Tax=Myotis lucifugus TaxID=59463 RepID=G1Q9U2_MYOLU
RGHHPAPPPGAAPAATEPPMGPRLGELTVTGVTPHSVGLAWTVPEGQFDSFMVQYEDSDGQLQVVPVAADQREATVPGLEPARGYRMLVYGLHGGQRLGPLSVGAVTVKTEPRLGELTVTDVTPSSVGLSWTVPAGEFDSFVVQYKDRDGQPRVVPVAADQRAVTVPGLEPNRKYRFLLFGIQEGKRRSPVSVEAKTAPKPRLGAELQVTSVTPDSVGLAWTVPEGQFDSFVVQYKDREGRPQVLPVEGSLREARVWGLDAARRYKLLLYGLHQGRRVGPLSAFAVTESELQLGELTVAEATPHTLHLSWTVTEGEPDSFEVQYTDQDGQLQVVSLGGDQNDITLSGLEPNHSYLVKVYAVRGPQRLGPIQVQALTAVKPLLGELTVTGSSPDSLSLSWTVPQGQFDHFLVQYKNGDGQPKAVRVPGHKDGVTISGLEPDHKYKMHLYGFHDGQRQGPASATGVTEPSTEAPEPPEEPLLGELTVTGSSPDSLSLSWTVPRGHFDAFTVQYKDRDGRPQVVRVGGEESEVTVRGLEPGRKYKMHLYGLHGGRRVGPAS